MYDALKKKVHFVNTRAMTKKTNKVIITKPVIA